MQTELTAEQSAMARTLLDGYHALKEWERTNQHDAYDRRLTPAEQRRANTIRVGADVARSALFAAINHASSQDDVVGQWVIDRILGRCEAMPEIDIPDDGHHGPGDPEWELENGE